MNAVLPSNSPARIYWIVGLAAILWLAAYSLINPLAEWIAYTALQLERDSHLGQSLAFFLYDIPKILLLLSGMIFVISIIRTFFSPERTRALLGGKREGEVAQLHDRFFDDALGGGGDETERDAEDKADADRDDADQNRHPRSGEDLRGDVAPERVGAEPMRRRRREQLVGNVDRAGREGRPDKR